ncbi:hypothetical protein GCM10020295_16150 [Streptomyces cinereospinus]
MLGVDRVGGGGWLTGCGTAVPGTTATVVDQRGAPLPPGTFGEIALTGTSLSRGYLRGPEQLDTFGAGGLRTGDAGFEYDGELFVVGRIGESMKIRGAHVHAEDVEAELAQHEEHAVSPCAVAFASLDDGDHCVVFVEGRVDAGWAERAARTVKALTHGAVRISVVQGARGRRRPHVQRQAAPRRDVERGPGARPGAPQMDRRARNPAVRVPAHHRRGGGVTTHEATEVPVMKPSVNLPRPRDLYDRWETQQWAVSQVRVDRDAGRWAELKPFTRRELLTALADLEIGEVCVTQTLSALVDHSPTEDDRIYLCTQMADEGRHVQFFKDYLLGPVGVDRAELETAGSELSRLSAYGAVFEPVLRQATGRVRDSGGEPAVWYAGVVLYHLVTEGVIAGAGLKTLRSFVRTVGGLQALEEGLANVARDETRHLTYGQTACRTGVGAASPTRSGRPTWAPWTRPSRCWSTPARRRSVRRCARPWPTAPDSSPSSGTPPACA